jgi:hypothetical protein
MIKARTKIDQAHELSRRALIKWSLAAGAALGVSRSRIFEVLEGAAGRGVAEAAAANPTRRSVHIRAGTGGLAWFQLLWPHNDVAAGRGPQSAWHLPGQEQLVAGTDRPLTIGPHTPFANLAPARQISAFVAGRAECHTNNPETIARALSGSSLFAIAASLQTTNPSVVPVIAVDDLALGTAEGAPAVARVPRGSDIVGLFNSAASRDGALLATRSSAELYRAHYATLAGLNRAADRSTTKSAYATGRSAARFVGTNLSMRLSINPEDEAAYGITPVMRPDLAELGRTLIVTAKAFQMGLTQSVIVPGLRDDPHGAFADPNGLTATAIGHKAILDGFMTDLTTRLDDVSQQPLADDVVMTIEGDTPKTPIEREGWSDSTPDDANWIYVLGAGALRTGWFGGVDRNGGVTGFNPATGASGGNQHDLQAQAAVAAVAYAIARGDRRRVQDFSSVDISGIVV